jgi:hypothetical protein
LRPFIPLESDRLLWSKVVTKLNPFLPTCCTKATWVTRCFIDEPVAVKLFFSLFPLQLNAMSWWTGHVHEIIIPRWRWMDTLHPGTRRLILRIQEKLGSADSEDLWGGPPDLPEMPGHLSKISKLSVGLPVESFSNPLSIPLLHALQMQAEYKRISAILDRW